jgi:hypothetical protein
MTIHVCCKYVFEMFQLFQTYVASVLSGCCICYTSYTRMLQVYVSNVSAASNVCCKCFIWMLQCTYTCCKCFISFGYMLQQMLYIVCLCARSEAGAAASTKHKAISIDVAVGTEHKATSIGEQQMWHKVKQSTKLHPWWTGRRRRARSYIHRSPKDIIIENGQTGGVSARALVSPFNKGEENVI